MFTIKIGDVVKLKSGSPLMTVKDLETLIDDPTKAYVLCVWFEGTQLKEAEFDTELLIVVNDNVHDSDSCNSNLE